MRRNSTGIAERILFREWLLTDDAIHEFIHALGNGRSVVMEANQLYVTRLGEISKRNQSRFYWTACRYVSECISHNVITSAYLQVFHIMKGPDIY